MLLDTSSNKSSLADNTASHLNESFYPSTVAKLLPLLNSAEHQVHDFKEALLILNNTCGLSLDLIDLRVLSELLSILCQSNRFRADVRIHERLGENTATHSVMATILANSLFSASGIFSNKSNSAEANLLTREISLGILIHDMGEILGEFNSVAQRARNSSLIENSEVEREVFEVSLKLALYATQSNSFDYFRETMQKLRERCQIGTACAIDNQELLEILSRIRKIAEETQLNASHQKKLEHYLDLFDAAEVQDPSSSNYERRFIGAAIKVIEHMQGTRHLLRFAATDAQTLPRAKAFIIKSNSSTEQAESIKNGGASRLIPYRYRDSSYLKSVLKYNESNLYDLFKNAKTPLQLSLAKTLRNGIYTTLAEDLMSAPMLIDRSNNNKAADGLSEHVAILTAPSSSSPELKLAKQEYIRIVKGEQLSLLKKHRKLRSFCSQPDQNLLEVETSGRLASLYLNAVQKDYIPYEDTPLALLSEIPKELIPLTSTASVNSLSLRAISKITLPSGSLSLQNL